MRLLIEMDKKNYDPKGEKFSRPSSRAIIIKDNKVAMIHSATYDYYKFPGGGIDEGESKEEAMIREVLEETGLKVIPSSIKEYGLVHRIEKGKCEPIFEQDNYYYFCDVEEELQEQSLSEYEKVHDFHLVYVDAMTVMNKNLQFHKREEGKEEMDRDSQVVQLLVEEGFLPKG
ncbi:MAG: NUDIX domain-containing protein [Erysipelotrichaceae bacterium]|nr:NUDIX domain-containing protein [Erysipelotrichaceae bacterium]